MLMLADVQAAMGQALVSGDVAAIAGSLRGGRHPEQRLAIHQRHYAASLTRALVDRFPATVWLAGSPLVTDAAGAFIREHPPSRPCIAEYGDTFPHYLGAHPAAAAVPYLAQFAELEWHLGRLALATERAPHVHHLRVDWALDELIALYLTDAAPDRFTLRREPVWLELRGLRGELEFRRMSAAEFDAATTGGDDGRGHSR
jgi:hypothetical protein